MNELPEGWVLTEIANVANIIMGQSPPSDTYNTKKIGLPFFQGKAEFTELHPVVRKWCSVSNKIAEPNDILLSVRAPVGATNISNARCCIGRGLSAIRYQYCHKFLFYYFNLIEKKLDEKGTGTTFRAISGDVIKSFNLPLPPLSEQQRIVAKLEELFSRLDKGVESLKTAQAQLKTYRQAVLKWAFEGKLTNENMKDGELPEGWKWVHISDVTNKMDQGWSPKCENEKSNSNNEWAVIKTTAIQHNNFFGNENKKLPKELKPRTQHELKENDILITRAGPRIRVGVCCLVKTVRPMLLNCDKAYRIKVKNDRIDPAYLVNMLNAPQFLDIIESCKSGGNDSGLNLTQNVFLSIQIPLPLIHEQSLIVSEIERRLSVCDKLEESIEQSLKQAEALRQSILKKAFEGRLLSETELTECRASPDWEPASALLERIRAERENRVTPKRGRKRKENGTVSRDF